MIRVRILLSLAVVVGALAHVPSKSVADGKLGRAREAVRKNDPPKNDPPRDDPKPRPKNEDHSESHDDHDDHDSHNSGNSGNSGNSRHDHHSGRGHRHHGSRSNGIVFFSSPRPCVEPIVLPIIETHIVSPPHVAYAQPLPYEHPVYESAVVEVAQPVPAHPFIEASPLGQEIVVIDESVGIDLFGPGPSKFWATVGSDFDGIASGGLGLLLLEPGSLGIDASVFTLRESTPTYRDHLWIGDANLVFEAVSGDVSGRIGLGVNWLSDSWGAEAGFNLTAGFDLPVTSRLLLSAEGDVGNLGDADFFHARVNLARRFESYDWMLGADHYNIGGAEINSFFTGIQIRF